MSLLSHALAAGGLAAIRHLAAQHPPGLAAGVPDPAPVAPPGLSGRVSTLLACARGGDVSLSDPGREDDDAKSTVTTGRVVRDQRWRRPPVGSFPRQGCDDPRPSILGAGRSTSTRLARSAPVLVRAAPRREHDSLRPRARCPPPTLLTLLTTRPWFCSHPAHPGGPGGVRAAGVMGWGRPSRLAGSHPAGIRHAGGG